MSQLSLFFSYKAPCFDEEKLTLASQDYLTAIKA